MRYIRLTKHFLFFLFFTFLKIMFIHLDKPLQIYLNDISSECHTSQSKTQISQRLIKNETNEQCH